MVLQTNMNCSGQEKQASKTPPDRVCARLIDANTPPLTLGPDVP